MSTSLYWRPIPVKPKEYSIGSIKYEIHGEIFGDSNGDASIGHGPTEVGSELLPFLRGIVASGNEYKSVDAKMLIDAINKHGKVEILIG